jgi:hypothetical protein
MIVHGGTAGSGPPRSTWKLSWSPLVGVADDRGLDAAMALAQSRPNPAARALTIDFRLAAAGFAEVVVHDLAGRVIRTLANRAFSAGEHRVTWDLADRRGVRVPAGVYFYRLGTAGRVVTRRAVVLD